eukprot:MONOS_4095.1-p1 / transcript=MONOS_4095.1 / gene=MONOS_4095 / organism=Monocercomonoides_exilis_PA203 / gene_product=unspecified product / transcript_product=unspecified product / location=Mono_scaffold00104:58896-60112(+) / protein_length=311 / sequence_SO=supercontig / SO=protein_coding / is_pseudo=false
MNTSTNAAQVFSTTSFINLLPILLKTQEQQTSSSAPSISESSSSSALPESSLLLILKFIASLIKSVAHLPNSSELLEVIQLLTNSESDDIAAEAARLHLLLKRACEREQNSLEKASSSEESSIEQQHLIVFPMSEKIWEICKKEAVHKTSGCYDSIYLSQSVKSGIWKCEVIIICTKGGYFYFGMHDNTIPLLKSGQCIGCEKGTIGYYGFGWVYGDGVRIGDADRWEDHKTISVEVNMNVTPHIAHFFIDDVKQPFSIEFLADEIRFGASFGYADEKASFSLCPLTHMTNEADHDEEVIRWGMNEKMKE